MNEQLYHVTSSKNIKSILNQGLKAQIGENSQSVMESSEAVYLCRRSSIPYWSIILGADAVFKVSNVKEKLCNEYDYSSYGEVIYSTDVPAADIELLAEHIDVDKDVMKDLCLSYIYSINHISVRLAKHYNRPTGFLSSAWDEQTLKSDIDSVLRVLGRLDYSCCTSGEISDFLVELGENGENTFVDTYNYTKTRLWEMLTQYPGDELKSRREELFNFIKNTFKDCLYVNTGGWSYE